MKHIHRQFLIIFLVAFILNAVWEHFHSILYVHYKGEVITSLILLRAALFDATFITLVSIPFLKKQRWVFVVLAILFAIGLEIFALKTGRWEYKDVMPIIPIIKTGLTPTIQLGLLGYISIKTATVRCWDRL